MSKNKIFEKIKIKDTEFSKYTELIEDYIKYIFKLMITKINYSYLIIDTQVENVKEKITEHYNGIVGEPVDQKFLEHFYKLIEKNPFKGDSLVENFIFNNVKILIYNILTCLKKLKTNISTLLKRT